MTLAKALFLLALALGIMKHFDQLPISWSTVVLPLVFLAGLYLGSLSSIFHKKLGG